LGEIKQPSFFLPLNDVVGQFVSHFFRSDYQSLADHVLFDVVKQVMRKFLADNYVIIDLTVEGALIFDFDYIDPRDKLFIQFYLLKLLGFFIGFVICHWPFIGNLLELVLVLNRWIFIVFL
jgi:hypothetical protein